MGEFGYESSDADLSDYEDASKDRRHTKAKAKRAAAAYHEATPEKVYLSPGQKFDQLMPIPWDEWVITYLEEHGATKNSFRGNPAMDDAFQDYVSKRMSDNGAELKAITKRLLNLRNQLVRRAFTFTQVNGRPGLGQYSVSGKGDKRTIMLVTDKGRVDIPLGPQLSPKGREMVPSYGPIRPANEQNEIVAARPPGFIPANKVRKTGPVRGVTFVAVTYLDVPLDWIAAASRGGPIVWPAWTPRGGRSDARYVVRPGGDVDVTYTWHATAKELSRLMHAINGNIAAPSIVVVLATVVGLACAYVEEVYLSPRDETLPPDDEATHVKTGQVHDANGWIPDLCADGDVESNPGMGGKDRRAPPKSKAKGDRRRERAGAIATSKADPVPQPVPGPLPDEESPDAVVYCFDYAKKGACSHGAKCKRKHDEHYIDQPCRDFGLGKCGFVHCKFLHYVWQKDADDTDGPAAPDPDGDPNPSEDGALPTLRPSGNGPDTVVVVKPTPAVVVDRSFDRSVQAFDNCLSNVLMTTQLYKNHVDRDKAARVRYAALLVKASIDETKLTGDQNALLQELFHKRLKKYSEVMTSDDTYTTVSRHANLTKDRTDDTAEGLATALSLVPFLGGFTRAYYAVRRPLRLFFTGASATTSFTQGLQTILRPHIPGTCGKDALDAYLARLGSPMPGVGEKIVTGGGEVTVLGGYQTPCSPCDYPVGFTIAQRGLWISQAKCHHSELLAILARQLKGPQYKPGFDKRLVAHPRWVGNVILSKGVDIVLDCLAFQHAPVSDDDAWDVYMANRPVGFLAKLRSGKAELDNAGGVLDDKDYRLDAFLKMEWGLTTKDETQRHTRHISACYRNAKYQAHVGPQVYVWQKDFSKQYLVVGTNLLDMAALLQKRFIYTSGMTGDQVGAIFGEWVGCGYDFAEADCSRADGTVNESSRAAEWRFYRATGMSHDVVDCLSRDIAGKGKTPAGYAYKDGPSEKSGRPTTSVGHTCRFFFVWAVVFALERWIDDTGAAGDELGDIDALIQQWLADVDAHHGADWNYHVTDKGVPVLGSGDGLIQLGDDSVAARAGGFHKALIAHVFQIWGYDVKAKVHANADAHNVRYCSSVFMQVTADSYVLTPDPFRVLAKTFLGIDRRLPLALIPNLIMGIAKSFKHYRWMPVLSIVIDNILSREESVKAYVPKDDNPHRIMLREEIVVDPLYVHASFVKIFGVPPSTFDHIDAHDWLTPGVVVVDDALDEMLVSLGHIAPASSVTDTLVETFPGIFPDAFLPTYEEVMGSLLPAPF